MLEYKQSVYVLNNFQYPVKSGVPPEEVATLAKHIIESCPNLKLEGLMTIGKYGYNPEDGPNPDFLCLRKCREDVCENLNIDWKQFQLSMGMSTDYEQAVSLNFAPKFPWCITS